MAPMHKNSDAGNSDSLLLSLIYAPGLAYDIDMSRPAEVLGTIAGADTVVAILAEGVTHEQAREVFEQFMPKNSPIMGSSQPTVDD